VIAVDTNVLVRIITRDDPVQAHIAQDRLRSEVLWIAKTVVQELEWVLRYARQYPRAQILAAFQRMLEVGTIEFEDRAAVEAALVGYANGMDLSDALHLASCGSARTLVTFDRAFCARAPVLGSEVAVELLESRPPDTGVHGTSC
jgi:predicted nucleic-acid-binding protein